MTGPDRLRWFMLAGFPAVYYLVLVAQGGLLYGRYLLPILPHACLLVACAAAALALVILFQPAWRSIDWLGTMAKGTTSQLLVQWLERHVPAGTRLVFESGGGLQFPAGRFRVSHIHRLASRRYADYAAAGEEYLIACSAAF
jgi:hypothetical protein